MESFLQSSLAGVEGDVHLELGEGHPSDGDEVSVDTGQTVGSIDENSVGSGDVHDDGELASERTVLDQDHTADLDEFLEELSNKQHTSHH